MAAWLDPMVKKDLYLIVINGIVSQRTKKRDIFIILELVFGGL